MLVIEFNPLLKQQNSWASFLCNQRQIYIATLELIDGTVIFQSERVVSIVYELCAVEGIHKLEKLTVPDCEK